MFRTSSAFRTLPPDQVLPNLRPLNGSPGRRRSSRRPTRAVGQHACRHCHLLLGDGLAARHEERRARRPRARARATSTGQGRRLVAARQLLGDLVRLRRRARRVATQGDAGGHQRRNADLARPHRSELAGQSPSQTRARRVSTICGTRRSIRAASSSTRDRRSRCPTASPASSPGIQNQRKSRVGASFAGQVLDATNNIIYEATIEPGWAGDLLKVTIDPTTAKEAGTVWQASAVLSAQIAQYISAAATPTVPASNGLEPWFTNRRIVTINDASGKPVAVPRHQAVGRAARDARPQRHAAEEDHRLPARRRSRHRRCEPAPPPATIYKPIEGAGHRPVPPALRRARRHLERASRHRHGAGEPVQRHERSGILGVSRRHVRHAQPRVVAPANDGIVHVFDEQRRS